MVTCSVCRSSGVASLYHVRVYVPKMGILSSCPAVPCHFVIKGRPVGFPLQPHKASSTALSNAKRSILFISLSVVYFVLQFYATKVIKKVRSFFHHEPLYTYPITPLFQVMIV